MFGIGKKDKDGKQVRIEHRSKHIRASRTGGVAARAEKKIGDVNLTVNTAKGVRINTRIAKGTRAAMQNGRLQLIGRWKSGPIGFNLSKTGVSASYKNEAGTFNFIKPQYSSIKFGGIQVRGKQAALIHTVYILFVALGTLLMLAIKLTVYLFWFLYLGILLVWDVLEGFIRGVREEVVDQKSGDQNVIEARENSDIAVDIKND